MKIEKVKKLEKKVSYGCGCGGPSKSCIKIKENVQDEDIEKYLRSKEEETLKIVLFLDTDGVEIIYIVGDGIVVETERKNVEYSLVALAAAYYVFDLAFPRELEQFLEFIKQYILDDEDKQKKKTSGFIEMLHKVENLGFFKKKKDGEGDVRIDILVVLNKVENMNFKRKW